MTTQSIQGLCSTGSCNQCGWHDVGPDGLTHTAWHGHEYVEHRHIEACDAAFWELLGCVPHIATEPDQQIVACLSDDYEHLMHWHRVWRTLAPILSNPSADASRLAMFDVLAALRAADCEIEIRSTGWPYITVQVWLPSVAGSVADVTAETVDDLPAAVAEAAIAALRRDE